MQSGVRDEAGWRHPAPGISCPDGQGRALAGCVWEEVEARTAFPQSRPQLPPAAAVGGFCGGAPCPPGINSLPGGLFPWLVKVRSGAGWYKATCHPREPTLQLLKIYPLKGKNSFLYIKDIYYLCVLLSNLARMNIRSREIFVLLDSVRNSLKNR